LTIAKEKSNRHGKNSEKIKLLWRKDLTATQKENIEDPSVYCQGARNEAEKGGRINWQS